MKHFSLPGQTIIDAFAGSGTGVAAAMLEGRHAIAVEPDERQLLSIKDRMLELEVAIAATETVTDYERLE